MTACGFSGLLRRACILGLLLVMMPATFAVEPTKDPLTTVQKNLAEKKALLLDVREQKEWDQGHLVNATLLPLSELRQVTKDEALRRKIESRYPKDQIIYCHCFQGARTISAAYFLEKLGYDVRPLSATYRELLEAGFREVKP